MQPSIAELSTFYFFSLLLLLDKLFSFRHKSFFFYGGYELVRSMMQALAGVARIVER